MSGLFNVLRKSGARKDSFTIYTLAKPPVVLDKNRSVIVYVKPLSINGAFQGRRFKTRLYEDYEKAMFGANFPAIKIPDGKLEIYFEFGFSNRASDWDNPVKPFQDILQKIYGFNDKMIYRAVVEKKDVPKGKDYIKFGIYKYNS